MADWSLIRTTLATWVNTITGVDTYWARRPRGMLGEATAILDIIGRRTVGNDDVIVEYDGTQPAGSEIRRYQAGARQFTFTIRFECQRTSDDVDALHYTSLVRDRTCLPETTADAWEAADIAFARVLNETDISSILDDREMSIAQIDLLINATALTEGTATGYVELLDDFIFYDPEVGITPPVWQGDIEVR